MPFWIRFLIVWVICGLICQVFTNGADIQGLLAITVVSALVTSAAEAFNAD